jgi:hypothetical protein
MLTRFIADGKPAILAMYTKTRNNGDRIPREEWGAMMKPLAKKPSLG